MEDDDGCDADDDGADHAEQVELGEMIEPLMEDDRIDLFNAILDKMTNEGGDDDAGDYVDDSAVTGSASSSSNVKTLTATYKARPTSKNIAESKAKKTKRGSHPRSGRKVQAGRLRGLMESFGIKLTNKKGPNTR